MNSFVTIGGRLALICAVAATVLGLVNAATEPVIEERRAQELRDALNLVAGGADIGEERTAGDNPAVTAAYPLSNPDGWVLRLVGDGYGGDLEIVAAYGPGGELSSAVLMGNQETPGLGKKAESPEYMEMFVGKGGEEPIPTRRGMLPQEQADAVSGATITFMGVAQALSEGSGYAERQGGEQ